MEWFASCQIITKNSVADAYGLEAAQLKDDDYRSAIASMLRIADFGIQSLQVREMDSLAALKQGSNAFPNINAVHMITDKNGKATAYTLNMTEGSQTEPKYFEHYRTRQTNIDIRVVPSRTSAGETDYISLIRKAIEYQTGSQLSVSNGDAVWVVADGDVTPFSLHTNPFTEVYRLVETLIT